MKDTLTKKEREYWNQTIQDWARDLEKTGCFASVKACAGRFEGEPESGYWPSTERLVEKATNGQNIKRVLLATDGNEVAAAQRTGNSLRAVKYYKNKLRSSGQLPK